MIKYLLLTCLIVLSSCKRELTNEELGEAYRESLENKEWSEALSHVEEGLKRDPSDTTLYFEKAYCLKQIHPIENHQEIFNSITVFLDGYKSSSSGLVLKYTNHFDNKQYDAAIKTVEQIEKYYGISEHTLLMKANAMYLNKDFEKAAFYYDETLMYPNNKKKFKTIYYFKIYAKYFAGNKEGALWDTAFLEDYGLEKDDKLLTLITKDLLDINDHNTIEFTIDAKVFEKAVVTENLDYDQLYRPLYGQLLFREPRYAANDIKTLDRNIEFLNLGGLKVRALPDEIVEFKKLKAIDLSRNWVEDFDKLFEQLSQLPNLEFLRMDRTNLKNFPKSIAKMKNLKGLSLYLCNIRKLPPEIGQLKNLGYLNIRSNGRLKDLPKEIKYLKNLNSLNISVTGIKTLREELGLCYNLVSITANTSKVEVLPENIGNLKNMRRMNFANCKVKKIPESIGELKYLEDLSLGSNDLERLPKSISGLENLESLSLDFNRFKSFPMEVLALDNLYSLWLHNNNIPEIPIEIGKLKNLTNVLVDHEVITDQNINQIKEKYPNINIGRHDSRKLVKGIKRKKL